jgi:hypothetical protein
VSDGTEPAGFWSRKKYPNNVPFWLCSMCTQAYNKRQYCDYCKQVYFEENESILDGKEWIGCDNDKCKKWNHVECEILVNNNEALKNLNEDVLYYCLSCSKNKKLISKLAANAGKSAAPKSR